MRLPVLFSLLTLSFSAAAQTVGSNIALTYTSGETSVSVGAGTCGEKRSVTWNAQATTLKCSSLVIWITTGQCTSSGPVAGDTEIGNVGDWQNLKTGTVSFAVSDLPLFLAPTDGGTASPCGSQVQDDMQICAKATVASTFGCGSNETTLTQATALSIRYDAVPPDPPSLTLSPLDQALSVHLTLSSDTEVVHLFRRTQGADAGFTGAGNINASAAGGKIEGLENGTTYEVQGIAEDLAGNQSAPSATVTGTPVHTNGFFDLYKQSGGAERGGCSAVGGGLSLGACVLMASLLSRRRRE